MLRVGGLTRRKVTLRAPLASLHGIALRFSHVRTPRNFMPVPRLCLLMSVTFALLSCKSTVTAGTGRTERERDSIIGQSKVPGAGAVQRALQVSDSAASRGRRLDSAAAQP